MVFDPQRHERALKAFEQQRGYEYTPPTSPYDPPSMKEITNLGLDRCYGDAWSRPGLDMRSRCLVTMSVLATLGGAESERQPDPDRNPVVPGLWHREIGEEHRDDKHVVHRKR